MYGRGQAAPCFLVSLVRFGIDLQRVGWHVTRRSWGPPSDTCPLGPWRRSWRAGGPSLPALSQWRIRPCMGETAAITYVTPLIKRVAKLVLHACGRQGGCRVAGGSSRVGGWWTFWSAADVAGPSCIATCRRGMCKTCLSAGAAGAASCRVLQCAHTSQLAHHTTASDPDPRLTPAHPHAQKT